MHLHGHALMLLNQPLHVTLDPGERFLALVAQGGANRRPVRRVDRQLDQPYDDDDQHKDDQHVKQRH